MISDRATDQAWLAAKRWGHGLGVAALIAMFLWVGVSLWAGLMPNRDIAFPTPTIYRPFLDDYVVFRVAGQMVLDGRAGNLYDLNSVKQAEADNVGQPESDISVLPYYNPPFFAGLLAPFAAVSLRIGAALFIAMSLGALAVALRLLLPALAGSTERLVWIAGILSAAPFYFTLYHGQLSFFLLLLLTCVFILFRKGADTLGGAILGLLLIKPPLVVIPLVILAWKRRWSALSGFSAVALVLVMVSIAIAGPRSIVEYPRLLFHASTWDNGEGGILIWAMFGWNAVFRGILGSGHHSAVSLLGVSASLGTVVILLRGWRGPWDTNMPAFGTRFAALVLAVLLTSPHLYSQDLMLVIIPVILLYSGSRSGSEKVGIGALLVLGWLLCYVHFIVLRHTGVNFVTLLLFVLLVMAALRPSLPPLRIAARRRLAFVPSQQGAPPALTRG